MAALPVETRMGLSELWRTQRRRTKEASHDDPGASPLSVHGRSRTPLQAAVLGAVAALAFTGDMIVHRAREESTAASRTVVQQHRIDSERARRPRRHSP